MSGLSIEEGAAIVARAREFATKHNPSVEKIGRNDPCPCNSGKKYKKCCWQKHVHYVNIRNSLRQARMDREFLNKVPVEEREKLFPGELLRIQKYIEETTPWLRKYESRGKDVQ